MTCSGVPVNRFLSSGSWVAMPTGQVFRWQTRIMMQPVATSGAVEKAKSSAPSRARHGDVAARLELAVGLQDDTPAQPVLDEDLLGLGDTELPRQPGVLYGGERRGPRPAVVARDGYVVGLRLRDPGSDRPDPDLGDELHAHPGAGVGVLEVVDELREVLDRVDVVVGRG